MRHAKTAMVWLGAVLGLVACGGSSLCDSAQLKLTCRFPNGQCVEYSGLSTADQHAANTNSCDTAGTLCPTAGRLGSCNLPPATPRSGVSCSPNAVIMIRYFAPFDQANAQSLCQGVAGAVWTPN